MSANPQQQAVIDAPPEGRIQVRALAGTGKSWTLKERALRILTLPPEEAVDDTPPWDDTPSQGMGSLLDQMMAEARATAETVPAVRCNGEKLLLIAFNKRIQVEMQEKLKAAGVGRYANVQTSHAFALSLLRQYREETQALLGIEGFDVVSKSWQVEKMAQEVLQREGLLMPKRDLSVVVKALIAVGNLERNCDARTFSRLVQRYNKPLVAFLRAGGNVAQTARAIYQDRYRRGQLSFDDMIPLACQLPDACFADLGYAHLMVDEVQDFNMIQHQLVEKIGKHCKSITMVGDIFQTIYRFTGAVPEVFDRIPELHGAQEFLLEGNYRSSPHILGFANQILSQMLHATMQLVPKREDLDDAPKPWVLPPGQGPAAWIHGVMAKYGYAYDDIAVLYRTNKQCLRLELDLLAAHVPYQAKTGGFLSLPVVKDLLSYLLMIVRPDNEWWETVVTHRKYLGKETAQTSWGEVAFGQDKRPWKTMPGTLRNQGQKNTWRELGLEMDNLQRAVTGGTSPATLILQLHQQLLPYWSERYADDPDALDDALDVAGAVMGWLGGMETLQELVDVLDARERLDANNGVTLLTIHRSKGLEWKVTLLYGAGESTFIRIHPCTTEEDLQDESRLLYVWATRGKEIIAVHCDEDDPTGGLPGQFLRMVVYGVAPDNVAGDYARDPLRGQESKEKTCVTS